LRSAVIFGGVGQGPQVKALAAGLDILVATPGRLLDLLSQRHVNLSKVSIIVLDEADRMLDMGFIRDVRKIVGFCPKRRQTLLFSATMPAAIAKLSAEILHQPVRVDVSPPEVTVDRIAQSAYLVPAQAKRALLTELIADPAMTRVLVFTRTKRGADRVCKGLLQSGVTAEAIHGNKAQNARIRALEAFRSGRARVLVATDIAARGIDVAGVSHVINYELPNEPESYVHRIGRTARAGAGGVAIAFCDPSERGHLAAIERLTGISVPKVGHRLARPDASPPQQSRRARGKTRSKDRHGSGGQHAGVLATVGRQHKGQRAARLAREL
jgi:ATP-dependent RNA helicase RhlE